MSICSAAPHSTAAQGSTGTGGSSGIWRSATAIASPNSATAGLDVSQTKPADKTAKPAADKIGAAGTSNPFEMLAPNLQALLTRLQASQTQETSTSTPTAHAASR